MVLTLDSIDDAKSLLARAAARAIGDGAIVGIQGLECRNGFFEEIAISLIRFGRKKLEGDNRLAQGRFSRMYIPDKLHGLVCSIFAEIQAGKTLSSSLNLPQRCS